MHILDEFAARGLLADVTDRDALQKLLTDGPVTLYAGYDPTSPSLHVGNLVPVIMQARLQRAGHKPIVVVGGATGMVGDPSGKSAERNLLARRRARRQRRRDSCAARALPRLRSGPDGRAPRQQRGLDARRRLSRIPARRRQAPDDQLHDGQGLRARAARRRYRHQLHRVLVHAAPGMGLRALVACARLPPPGRRLGSVRQHHGGLRAVAQDGRPAALRPHGAAAARLLGAEDGQDLDRRARVARRRAHVAVRVLPVLLQRDRRGGAAPATSVLVATTRRSSRSSAAPTMPTAASGSRSASSRAP